MVAGIDVGSREHWACGPARADDVPDWDGWVDGFEVEEVQRVLEAVEELPQGIAVHLRAPAADNAELDLLPGIDGSVTRKVLQARDAIGEPVERLLPHMGQREHAVLGHRLPARGAKRAFVWGRAVQTDFHVVWREG